MSTANEEQIDRFITEFAEHMQAFITTTLPIVQRAFEANLVTPIEQAEILSEQVAMAHYLGALMEAGLVSDDDMAEVLAAAQRTIDEQS